MKNKIIAICALIMTAIVSYAQREIKGIVIDDNGDPLTGAVVKADNTKGTVTDMDGNFNLMVDESVKTISVSYVGYKPRTIKVADGRDSYRVALQLDVTTIKDVVVIGYGAVKRGDVTAAISKIDGEDLEDRPVTNVASLLQGELAGVEVRNISGAPGGEVSINVRGSVTLNDPEANGGDLTDNTTPLYVIDGIAMDDDFDISLLSVNDIASIEVLKDASSSAIYGSRGANGVIIITTKKGGKGGRFNISASANFSLQQVAGKLDVMNGEQWSSWMTQLANQNYVNQYGNQGASVEDGMIIRRTLDGHAAFRDGGSNYTSTRYDPRWIIPGHPGVSYIDWQDQILRVAPQQQYSVAASGQTKESSYRVSVNYANQQGIIKGTDYQRISTSLQGQTTVNMFTFGVNAAPSFSVSSGSSTAGSLSSNSLASDKTNLKALQTVPIAEDEAGVYTGSYPYANYAWTGAKSSNPYIKLENVHRESQLFQMRSSAFIRVNPIEGLQLELLGAWNMRHQAIRRYIPSNMVSTYEYEGEGVNTLAQWQDRKNHSFTLQATANYLKKWGKHDFNFMLGWSTSLTKYADNIETQAENFINDALLSYNQTTADVTTIKNTYTTSSRMVSYFGRVIYNFDNRYIFNASLRRDGSSRFGEDRRWATFPSFSGAWRVSNESFWPENFFVNSLKLRMSYGLNGRNNINSNAIKTTLSPTVAYFGENLYRGYILNNATNRRGQEGNSELGWQKVDSWDFAVDVGLWKNRVSFAFDYYYKRTRDLLYQMTMPAISGYNQTYFNVGSIENHGIDLELRTINILKPFKWTSALNIGFQGSKVLDLGGNNHIETGYTYKGAGGKCQILEVGREVGVYYLYDAIGVFQTQEELDNYPHIADATVGSVKLCDTNGDGEITTDDRIYAGNPRPDVTFGFTNRFNYKNWELSFLITGQFGGKIFAASGYSGLLDAPVGSMPKYNMMDKYQNMWFSEENPGNGEVPFVMTPTGYANTTRNLYSSDYIRVKNVTLAYKIPLKKTSVVKNMSVMFSIENLAQWDKYDAGYSPEGAVRMTSTSCYDEVAYPTARTYSLGVKISM